MPLTWLDILLVVIMLVSGLLAMMRGFVREALAVLAWAGALVATWVMFPILKEPVQAKIQPDILANVLVLAGVFLTVLIVISVVTVRFTDVLLESRVGALDRTFGFIFGVARGLLLVVIAYLFFAWLVPQNSQPEWVRNARSLPLIVETGDYIYAVLPDDLQKEFFRPSGDIDRGGGSQQPPAQEQPGEIPESSDQSDSGVYRNSERRSLNQLLESSGTVR